MKTIEIGRPYPIAVNDCCGWRGFDGDACDWCGQTARRLTDSNCVCGRRNCAEPKPGPDCNIADVLVL